MNRIMKNTMVQFISMVLTELAKRLEKWVWFSSTIKTPEMPNDPEPKNPKSYFTSKKGTHHGCNWWDMHANARQSAIILSTISAVVLDFEFWLCLLLAVILSSRWARLRHLSTSLSHAIFWRLHIRTTRFRVPWVVREWWTSILLVGNIFARTQVGW